MLPYYSYAGRFVLRVPHGRRLVETSRVLYHPVDGNTKIEAKLEAGGAATIDYRAEDVNNFAVRVAVHPAA